ncbi:Pimeloyl-ACP methyl ester carboxylesterase [Rhizobiales bacterium GAS191]|nr:Pimeloyl-ACP methyl ester carboxylesterase [Rhizobiales bacterium GAS191]
MMDATDADGRRSSTCENLTIRGLRCNLRRWGRAEARPILFLHGTQDSSVTFQFVIDHFQRDWCVFAPDWRGHGHSEWSPSGYWFHDFVADLSALVDLLFPDRAVPIVGHSLGGNVAGVFAGLRPGRLSHLVSLDGFGPLVDRVPVDVTALLRSYLDRTGRARRHAPYADTAQMAHRLARANSRLTRGQALFLAQHSSSVDEAGKRCWLFDPTHQASLPALHTMAEWARIWSEIRVPVCWISSSDTRPNAVVNFPQALEERSKMIPRLLHVRIPGTGHNLHHDAPAKVAAAIEDFLGDA